MTDRITDPRAIRLLERAVAALTAKPEGCTELDLQRASNELRDAKEQLRADIDAALYGESDMDGAA